MRNWIRRVLGINVINKMVNENNKSTQTKLEQIVGLLGNSEKTLTKLDSITELLETKVKGKQEVSPEIIREIQIRNEEALTKFNLDTTFQLDDSWVLLNNTKHTENFFSQICGASTMAATTAYASNGLYSATVSVSSLMNYSDGTISSITMNGSKFGQHAGFISANTAVFTPILAFQFASMLTGQYYFKGLSKQLTAIHNGINQLISFHHNERLAKLQYINFKVAELNRRTFFTIEDYISINQLKFELSTIRHEYLLIAAQEINKALDKVNDIKHAKSFEILTEDTNSFERTKLSIQEKFSKLSTAMSEKFNSLYQDSYVNKRVESIKKFTENSNKKVTKLSNEILNSNYFFYANVSLKSEHLYQLAKLLELKINLSDREPDTNRIGKIKELYKSIAAFNVDDSVFDEFETLNNQLKTKLITDIAKFKDNSFSHKNKIIDTEEKIKVELNKTQDLISRKHILFRDVQEIKNGFEKPTKVLIDNRFENPQIYFKHNV